VAVRNCKIRAASSNRQVSFRRPDEENRFDAGKPVAVTPGKSKLGFHIGLDIDWGESQLPFEVEKCCNETASER